MKQRKQLETKEKQKKKQKTNTMYQDEFCKGETRVNVKAFDQSMELIHNTLPQSMKWIEATALDTPEEYQSCSADLVTLEGALSKADVEGKKYTKPLLDVKKSIDAKFKLATEPVQAWADHMRMLVEGYVLEERKKAMKLAEKQAEKFIKAGAIQIAEDIRNKAFSYVPATGTKVTFRDIWEIELVDIVEVARAVADGRLPPGAIQLNNTYWTPRIRSEKGSLTAPGVNPKLVISSVVGA